MKNLLIFVILILSTTHVFGDEQCEKSISFEHEVHQDSRGRLFWQKAGTSFKVYQDSIVCVNEMFQPRSQPILFLPKLKTLNHFSDSINYGVKEILLPSLESVNALLISSFSYPNFEVKRIDLSRLRNGTLHLVVGNATPNLEEIKINKDYWEQGNLSMDSKQSILKYCKSVESNIVGSLIFNCK